MIKHLLIIGYIALICGVVNRVFHKYGIDNFLMELIASWLILTTSMYAFGAYLVYFK